jgi:murein DD-endopeptidase MepM/ murein hydrolase activator NlpD
VIARAACRRRALQGAVAVTVLLAHASTVAGITAKATARQPARMHEVERGDTLTNLARRYGVTVPDLVAANRLPDDRAIIRVGQRLTIPAPRQGTDPAPAPPVPRQHLRPRPPAGLVLTVPDFADRPPLFSWPADGHVTSVFGRRGGGWHQGIDIKGDLRGPVLASAGGVVVASGFEPLYGRVVKIEHANGFLTVYAHNDRNLVAIGDRILPGQTIASIGRTGRATAHHLHFEIRQRGLAYNPLYLLPLPSRIAVIAGAPGDYGPGDDKDAHE